MATTSRPISELAVGIRDTSGAVVASGKVRFYQPGTLTTQTVYSDSACTTALSQPVTLNAGGQATVYTLEAVRMIAKDSGETTTYYDDVVNLNRHDAVYVTSTNINGGAETTLETVLSTLTSSLGADFKYLESSGATSILYSTWLGELVVSVKDFGALGDDSNDDTAEIQAACDRVEARGGGWVYFPKGTYKITSAITIDTAGVKICGAGRGIAVVKNYGTTTNAFTVTLGSAVDTKIQIKDISITASTTSSGKGIEVTVGTRVVVSNVAVALHRTGIDTSAVAGTTVRDCVIESTDDNAAAKGITVGSRGRVVDCEVISGTDNGDGITLAADAVARSCFVNNFAVGVLASGNWAHVAETLTSSSTTGFTVSGTGATATDCSASSSTTGFTVSGADAKVKGCDVDTATTGINLTGARSMAVSCRVATTTTGIILGAANTTVSMCHSSTATTGYSVGAFASCTVALCHGATNTTDLSVNASATLFQESQNTFTGTITNSADTPRSLPFRFLENRPAEDGTAAPTFTPDISGGKIIQIFQSTYGAGAPTVTIAAHSTATLAEGDIMILLLSKKGGGGNMTVTWNAQYTDIDGSAINGNSMTLVVDARTKTILFRWQGTEWRRLLVQDDIAF